MDPIERDSICLFLLTRTTLFIAPAFYISYVYGWGWQSGTYGIDRAEHLSKLYCILLSSIRVSFHPASLVTRQEEEREKLKVKERKWKYRNVSCSKLSLEIFDTGTNYRYPPKYRSMSFPLCRFSYRLVGSDVSRVISGQRATQRPRMDEPRLRARARERVFRFASMSLASCVRSFPQGLYYRDTIPLSLSSSPCMLYTVRDKNKRTDNGSRWTSIKFNRTNTSVTLYS